VTSAPTHDPILIVHGGAWAIPADAAFAHESGVRNALETGYRILALGGSALDAVEAAVTVLEDDPTFDAGRGSFLTSDGRVQLDALLMDGGRMKAGGVACVERLRNPIQAARLVLEKSPHVYFVAEGAERFAASHGMPLIDNAELVLPRERERLLDAQARQSAGLADETFSGQLADDKDPATAFRQAPQTPGGPGLASETWESFAPARPEASTIDRAEFSWIRPSDASVHNSSRESETLNTTISVLGPSPRRSVSRRALTGNCINGSVARAASLTGRTSCSGPGSLLLRNTARMAPRGSGSNSIAACTCAS
jgi:beta-aspartyl-peptidase (threonine type)